MSPVARSFALSRDVLLTRVSSSDDATQISDLLYGPLLFKSAGWGAGGGEGRVVGSRGWVGINGAADERRSVARARRQFYRPLLQHRHGLPLPTPPGERGGWLRLISIPGRGGGSPLDDVLRRQRGCRRDAAREGERDGCGTRRLTVAVAVALQRSAALTLRSLTFPDDPR